MNKINKDIGNGVTSFFIKKSIYNTFFRISTIGLPYNYLVPTLGINQSLGEDVTINSQKTPIKGQTSTTAQNSIENGPD